MTDDDGRDRLRHACAMRSTFCVVLGWLGLFGSVGANLHAAMPNITTTVVSDNLDDPVFVTHAPRDFDRIFVLEQQGEVRVINIKTNTLLPTPFLDLTDRVLCCGERGLLGMAFHPDYPDTPYVYVNYTDGGGSGIRTVVSRFTVPADSPDVADIDSETTILTFDQIATNHNAGWMGFSPNDGYLYIATGDGGGGCDPQSTGQDLNRLLGKILRIDVDQGAPYAIPPDNPFVGSAGLDEIWHYGLRNPWRCSFDAQTGDLFIADVGQIAFEEVNFQPGNDLGGKNFGWVCREGSASSVVSACTIPKELDCESKDLVDPILEYAHDQGRCSITGGEVYRGCNIPGLEGHYLFGDYCTGEVWSYQASEGAPFAPTGISLAAFSLTSFGRDAYGEIYICNGAQGQVDKIVPTIVSIEDCNSNGEADACDLLDGTSTDDDKSGVLDECEFGPPIPTVSNWGILVLVLSIIAMGTIAQTRRTRNKLA